MTRRRKSNAVVLGAGRTIRVTAQGTFLAYWRPSRSSSMERRRFPSFEAARAWLEGKAGAGPMPPLTPAQYVEAQAAFAALPSGVSLMDCVRTYGRAAAAAEAARSVPFAEAVSRFLAERARIVKAATLTGYRRELGRLSAALGDGATLADATVRRLAAWADGFPNAAARNKALRNVSPLLAWAVRRGWLQANPADSVERGRVAERAVDALTVEEAEAVLRLAEASEPAAVPYLAVGMFAGVRPEELLRIGPEAFRNGFVVLDGRVTKTARARTIDLRANLAAWLEAFPWPAGGYRSRPSALRRVCRVIGRPWPPDALRHSFATYAYEQTRDAARVCAEMGHAGSSVFFRHYRALASPGDGERFFAIMPMRPTGGR